MSRRVTSIHPSSILHLLLSIPFIVYSRTINHALLGLPWVFLCGSMSVWAFGLDRMDPAFPPLLARTTMHTGSSQVGMMTLHPILHSSARLIHSLLFLKFVASWASWCVLDILVLSRRASHTAVSKALTFCLHGYRTYSIN
ncbi:hypothetical protein BKA70DRAFT_187989 [Coprinopsis sp. MPI-PUGE-AT-0042]|nr:hypothetical protein BKA70DRAFT_187989 [Coprinopsis sp. MPI-PUGE-AT-0042]